MPSPVSTLWLMLPALPRALLGAWIAWMVVAALGGHLLIGAVGPFGTAIAVVVAGVWLARQLPGPLECLCRHHLDDTEITRLGPGRSVTRLEWSEVRSCT